MNLLRMRGFVAVAMAIALLALEAIAVVGATRAIAWWESPRPAVLARAGVTVLTALAGSASRALVSATMPAALTAVRNTNRWGRAFAAVLPGAKHGCSRSAVVAMVPGSTGPEGPAPTVAVALALERHCDRRIERRVVVNSTIRRKACTIVRREVRALRTRTTS